MGVRIQPGVNGVDPHPEGCHPLVHPVDGSGGGHEPDGGLRHLAGLRPATAPHRELQALARTPIHRQGERHRGSLPDRPGGGGGAVRRREVADPGAGPHCFPCRFCPGCPNDVPTTTAATAPPTGSTWWNGGSANSGVNGSDAAPTVRSRSSWPPSVPGSPPGTTTPVCLAQDRG